MKFFSTPSSWWNVHSFHFITSVTRIRIWIRTTYEILSSWCNSVVNTTAFSTAASLMYFNGKSLAGICSQEFLVKRKNITQIIKQITVHITNSWTWSMEQDLLTYRRKFEILILTNMTLTKYEWSAVMAADIPDSTRGPSHSVEQLTDYQQQRCTTNMQLSCSLCRLYFYDTDDVLPQRPL